MLRALMIAASLVGLAACARGDGRDAFAESRVPPSLSARFQPPEGWAWGFLRTGLDPVQRYGVASTSRAPRAIVVVVPGYGESAEVWFETVRDLLGEGFTVWVLDRAGQGGSERFILPRDLGHAPSFDNDVESLRHLMKVVIRAPDDMPVVVLAQADGALVALAATELGLKVDAVIATSPQFASTQSTAGPMAVLDRTPAPGWKAWSRDRPDDRARGLTHDKWRGAVGQAWQTANPDLRMSGPSRGWISAHRVASRRVLDRAASARAEILLINPDPSGVAFCEAAPKCGVSKVSGGLRSLHLESDTWRTPWRALVSARIESAVAARRLP